MISLAPAILGMMAVLQAGLNRKISAQWGLGPTVLLNASVLLLCAITIVLLSGWRSDLFPAYFRAPEGLRSLAVWFIVPGLCGFALVLGGPWAIARWGAVHTFVLLIAGQLVASLLWDYAVEGRTIGWSRGIGVLVAWLGAFLATRG